MGVAFRPKGESPGAVPGPPQDRVPSSKKGSTRLGAGGLVTLFLRLVAPASRAATIARGELWLMTGIKWCDYVGRLGIAIHHFGQERSFLAARKSAVDR